ncbi:MAG: SusC/RagA family TonB-linked outer membrane protein, partial [Paludibacter sp.]|nr:SusC/RagA family TonB-linked outer membrane protein [Paludibacter sp.]
LDIEAKNNMVVKLENDAVVMNELVVTALGISREKKSLGYSVQEVSGDAVNQVKSDNFMTSLSGKVSGIQIKNNTNFGGSTNVIIRGSSSLTGNNQALFVVDGIPIDNSNTNNSGELTGRGGYDYGNSASDINPNDIESISVLKGAAASALYGSRATNGVVLITTKKGLSNGTNKPNVKLSSNVTTSTIDKSTFPTYQQDYGAGYGTTYYSDGAHPGLELNDVNGDGVKVLTTPYYEDASRGEKFDPNLMVYQWDAFDPASPNYGKATPWVASGANGPISLFETGVSTSNNIDISGGDKNTTYRFSYTNFSQKGIMPNSFLNKNNAVFNGSHNITDKLKITTSATYTNTAGKGRPSTGYSDNIMSSFRQWSQTNVDYTMQKLMYEKTHTNATWNRTSWDDGTPAYWDNPYWVRYENYETDNRSRLIGYAQLDWTITSDLKAMARYAIDTYTQLQEEHKAVGSVAGEFGVGRPDVGSGYSRYTRLFTETNLDFMLNYHKAITDKIDLSALLGSNIRRTQSESVFESTNGGLAVAGVYALSNSVAAMLPPEETFTQVGVNGFFGSATLSYDNTYFLDATMRRDESSTLPLANRVYWYPSVTGSFLFSNLLNLDWLTLGKLRLNYAEVGGSAPALSVKDTYVANAPFSGNSLVTVPNTKLNENLVPERQKALEGGLEMKMFKNRLGFDLAFYKNNTINQLMPVSVSYATGYSSKWVNAGEIQNQGVELTVSGTPIQTKDFSWDINVNWASNKNQVVSLFVDQAGNEVTNLQIASLQGGVTINARKGQPYGAILGSDFIYTNGQKTVNATTGRYLKTATNDQVLGNVNPDWTGGINNTFRYKNVALSFLIDVSHGGSIFSLDMWYGTATGLYQETAGLNDLGNQKRDPIKWKNAADHTQGYDATSGGVINPGVLPDGTPNTVRRNQENYLGWGYAYDPNARFIYDASYVKLREVTLTYNFPKEIYSKLSLTNASLGLVGSNLWIIAKNLPYADPEASQSSGNIQGWQSGVMPATRNVGVTLNLQF